MADIALGSVERIFKARLAIKKGVVTGRQNRKECRDIERSVARVGALLSLLNEMTETLKPLEDLAESMEDALELIEGCDGRHTLQFSLPNLRIGTYKSRAIIIYNFELKSSWI